MSLRSSELLEKHYGTKMYRFNDREVCLLRCVYFRTKPPAEGAATVRERAIGFSHTPGYDRVNAYGSVLKGDSKVAWDR